MEIPDADRRLHHNGGSDGHRVPAARRTPNLVLPLACVFIARTYADMNFRKIIGTHLAAGGRQGSWWLVVGVSLLFALAIVAVVTAVFVVISWDEIDVTTAALKAHPPAVAELKSLGSA